MTPVDVKTLVEIGSQRPGPCISFFVPAPPSGLGAAQAPVHLSNMVREVIHRLAASGMRQEDARRLLQPINRMLEDPVGLQGPGQGLAIFVSPGTVRTVRAAPAFRPSFVIARRFVTRPLLATTREHSTFYLLALSQGAIRLLRVAGTDVGPVDVHGMPASISDILRFQEVEAPSLEFHSAGRRRQGDVATFHGTTELSDVQKAALLDLLRAVDSSVRPVVDSGSAPLVLASVDYLDSTFREITTCRSLIEGRVSGSPDKVPPRELAQKARAPVEAHRRRRVEQAVTRFNEMVGGPRASLDSATVLRAAHQRRVEDLFVARDAQLWGTFDPAAGTLTAAPTMGPELDDLLDLAATRTLGSAGNVYALPLSEMPGSGPAPLAATFRFG